MQLRNKIVTVQCMKVFDGVLLYYYERWNKTYGNQNME